MSKENILSNFTSGLLAALLLVPSSLVFAASLTDGLSVPRAEANQIAEQKEKAIYIVRMADDPVVAYDGGIAGLKATKPKQGKKIDPNSSRVSKYVDYLSKKHRAAIAKVGGKKVYNYYYSFNGFAARLNGSQAARLAATPGIVSVEKDVMLQLDTNRTPGMLGLTDPGGLWDQLGGSENAGEGVIGVSSTLVSGLKIPVFQTAMKTANWFSVKSLDGTDVAAPVKASRLQTVTRN